MISMSNSISTVSRAMGHSFFKTIERLSITFTSNGKREFVPRDQVSSRLLFIISTHKLVVSRNFLEYPKEFSKVFLSAHFLFSEILNLNLKFAVWRLRKG